MNDERWWQLIGPGFVHLAPIAHCPFPQLPATVHHLPLPVSSFPLTKWQSTIMPVRCKWQFINKQQKQEPGLWEWTRKGQERLSITSRGYKLHVSCSQPGSLTNCLRNRRECAAFNGPDKFHRLSGGQGDLDMGRDTDMGVGMGMDMKMQAEHSRISAQSGCSPIDWRALDKAGD